MRTPREIETEFAPRAALAEIDRLVLVGIGGAGMSALVPLAAEQGFTVSGTDAAEGPEVRRLRDLGFAVHIGHTASVVQEAWSEAPGKVGLVLTDAIDLAESPEVAAARDLGVPLFRRSQLLGHLLRKHRMIAVTGTHGKSTTTGMLGAGLAAAGHDPLVIVGAAVPEFGGPVRAGRGEWAVVEACEAYDALRDLDPEIAVVTNLEADHLDFHGNWENLRETVRKFLIRAQRVMTHEGVLASDGLPIQLAGEYRGQPALPGAHNRANAALAWEAAKTIGADPDRAKAGIDAFRGVERRLQLARGAEPTIIDDYAHHPTEIRATIAAVRERYPGRRLVAVFQPHLYSRTEEHLTEFPQSLSAADFVFLTDIYPAREAPRPGVSSARIGELLQPPYQYVPSRHRLPSEVAGFLRADDVVVIMGAGNIAELAPLLNATWEDRTALNAGRRALRVAVLQGGDSSEREVSLHSSRAAAAALRSLGHEVATFDATELLLGAGSLKPLVDYRPDVAFLGVHGRRGEDGALQGLLELLHIPYTGSGILASARAMDKDAAKAVLARHGIAVPRGVLITQPEAPIEVPGPWVVKPNEEGSTIGLSFVETESDLAEAIRLALRFGRQVLVEEWLRGMEISVPVLVDRALPAIEIVPDGGRYDFARKYLPGATEEIVPARLPEETLRAAEDVALRCHQALGCRGATRTDMMVVPEPDGTYAPSGLRVLEVNTLPGLTETSLLPRSAQAAGIGFAELCQEILNDALAQA